MKLFIKNKGDCKFSSIENDIEEIKIQYSDKTEINIDGYSMRVKVEGVQYRQTILGEFKDSLELEIPKEKIQHKANSKPQMPPKRVPNEASKQIKVDPVTNYFDGVYENYINIIKQFWK